MPQAPAFDSDSVSTVTPLPAVRPDPTSAALAELEARFVKACPNSVDLAERARTVIPGGVTHDNRFQGVTPLYISQAQGAYKTDVDGHVYLDYWMGHGALLLGHGRPEVVAAIQNATQAVTHAGACHEWEVRWAEAVCRLIPSAARVRFTSSGSEATALAVRLARAGTGKRLIIKFEGHFHGWLDHAVEGVDLPFEQPWSQGVPAEIRAGTKVLPAHDLAAMERMFLRGDVAGVIVEPTGAAGGAIPLRQNFLHDLRGLCTRHNVRLIFDEVITAFRLAPGGAQERFDVRPDLTCLAKVLAGGMPGGAVCGTREAFAPMDFSGVAKRDRTKRVAQYGTFNASPTSAAAGIAALELLADGGPCRAAEKFTDSLRERLNNLFRKEDVPFAVYGFSSIFHFFCADAQVARQLRDGQLDALAVAPALLKSKGALDGVVRRALLLEGLDLPPGRQAWTSAAHGPTELERTLEAFSGAIKTLRDLGCL